jgi:hypothetical protein
VSLSEEDDSSERCACGEAFLYINIYGSGCSLERGKKRARKGLAAVVQRGFGDEAEEAGKNSPIS